jgi:hypothetical protein
MGQAAQEATAQISMARHADEMIRLYDDLQAGRMKAADPAERKSGAQAKT